MGELKCKVCCSGEDIRKISSDICQVLFGFGAEEKMLDEMYLIENELKAWLRGYEFCPRCGRQFLV